MANRNDIMSAVEELRAAAQVLEDAESPEEVAGAMQMAESAISRARPAAATALPEYANV